MKAVLVLDEIPENCINCQLVIDEHKPYAPYYRVYCTALEKQIGESWLDLGVNDFRPDYCPLKELPDKRSMDDYDEHVPEDLKKLLEYYNDGFNDCLNQILGKED